MKFQPFGIVLRECSLHIEGVKRWIGLPSKPQLDSDGRHKVDTATGKRLNVPIVEVAGREPRQRFQAAALAAVDRLLAGETAPEPSPRPTRRSWPLADDPVDDLWTEVP